MGCNTSQEPAPVSVENDDTGNATEAGNGSANAEPETKKESEEQNHKPTAAPIASEAPLVNGEEPLGKDEGKALKFSTVNFKQSF